MPQKSSLVQWNGAGTVTMSNVAGGSGGIGAIELRFTSDTNPRNVTVRVNSTDYNMQLTGLTSSWANA